MKKSILFIGLGIIIACHSLSGQLYVAAPSGLSLREAPNSNSRRIELLPYGLEIKEYIQSYDHMDVIDGHSGYWYILNKNGNPGYFFSGYTLPYRVPKTDESNLEAYLARIFNKPICMDSVKLNGEDGIGSSALYTTIFKNGIVYTYTYGYEWHELSLLNLDISLSQAYLYACLLDRTFQCIYKTVTTGDNQIRLEFPASGTTKYNGYEIQYDGTEVFITTEHYFIKIFYLHGRTAISWGGGV